MCLTLRHANVSLNCTLQSLAIAADNSQTASGGLMCIARTQACTMVGWMHGIKQDSLMSAYWAIHTNKHEAQQPLSGQKRLMLDCAMLSSSRWLNCRLLHQGQTLKMMQGQQSCHAQTTMIFHRWVLLPAVSSSDQI